MKDSNQLINERLDNVSKRITRLSFLHSHLKKFKEDLELVDKSSRVFNGVSLFYYYSFSQIILELDKLFSQDKSEYYSIYKLLNQIESNIKYVKWHNRKTIWPEVKKEDLSSNIGVWSTGKTTEWSEIVKGKELDNKKALILKLKDRISEIDDDLELLNLARDKVIAHLDKNVKSHKIRIELEQIEKVLEISHEVCNTLSEQLKGTSIMFDHIHPYTASTLMPISKFYQIRRRVYQSKASGEVSISVDELNNIIKE